MNSSFIKHLFPRVNLWLLLLQRYDVVIFKYLNVRIYGKMLYFQIAWDLNKMKINVKKNMLVNICLLEKNDFFAKVSLFPLD